MHRQPLRGHHLRAPATDEGDFIEQGSLDDLGQGLHHILHINVADEQTQPEAALQLLDAMVHILRLQQVESATCMHTHVVSDAASNMYTDIHICRHVHAHTRRRCHIVGIGPRVRCKV